MTNLPKKYQNQVLVIIGLSLVAMEATFYYFGKLDGLVCIMIAMIVQISILTARVYALERELQISREPHEPPTMPEKTV